MKRTTFIMVCLCLIFLGEVITIQLINAHLYLIIDTKFYFGLIGTQVICFLTVIGGGNFRRVFLFNLLFLLLIPVVLMFSLPNYTYESAKTIIKAEFNGEDLSFTPIEQKIFPIDEVESFGSWVMKDYYYYYQVEYQGETYFFLLNPFTGKINQFEGLGV